MERKQDLVHHGVKRDCCKMGRAFPCNFMATLITYEEGKEKVRTTWYGVISVKLPGRTERLFMVVVKKFGRGTYNAFDQLKGQSEG